MSEFAQSTSLPEPEDLDRFLEARVPGFRTFSPPDQDSLRQLAQNLFDRDAAEPFVVASLRSTADVLRELREDEEDPNSVFRRAEVQRFIDENAVPRGRQGGFRSERKRQERDRLQGYIQDLLREARSARARHEVKKTRNLLMRLDQREIRRKLGREADELCRQINTVLRQQASML